MKKILLLCTILMVSVMTTACINNLAIKELNNKAESYLDKGETETAICRLKSSLDLDNEIYQTHYNLAVAYNTIGNYEGAIEEANKVLELKPELSDAYYIIAVAKEAIAYKTIEDNTNSTAPSVDAISEFNSKAQESIDTYNKYLVKVPNAQDSEKINGKIDELNKKIKELTEIQEKATNSSDLKKKLMQYKTTEKQLDYEDLK